MADLGVAVAMVLMLCMVGPAFTKYCPKAPYGKSLRYNTQQMSNESKITWVKHSDINKCYRECKGRDHCDSFTYLGPANLCMLNKATNVEPVSKENFIYSKKIDWEEDSCFDANDFCANCKDYRACYPERKACEVKECPHPENKPNTFRRGNMYRVGDKIKYFCNPGTNSNGGNGQAVCQKNGNWSETKLECANNCQVGKWFRGYCYYYEDIVLDNIAAAEDKCQGLYDSSVHLATIADDEERDFVLDNLLPYGELACINAFKDSNNTLVTMNGSKVNYPLKDDIGDLGGKFLHAWNVTDNKRFAYASKCHGIICEKKS